MDPAGAELPPDSRLMVSCTDTHTASTGRSRLKGYTKADDYGSGVIHLQSFSYRDKKRNPHRSFGKSLWAVCVCFEYL